MQNDSYSGEYVLPLRDAAIAALGPQDVLNRLAIAGINFMDVRDLDMLIVHRHDRLPFKEAA